MFQPSGGGVQNEEIQFQNLGLICSDFAWKIPVSLGVLPVYLGVFKRVCVWVITVFFEIVRTQKILVGLCFKNPLTGEFLSFVGEILRNPQNPLGIRPRCRGALQCVSGLRAAPATLGAALCGAVGAWGRSLGRGEERQALGHLGTKTPMELQNWMELPSGELTKSYWKWQ